MKELFFNLWENHGDYLFSLGGKVFFVIIIAIAGRILVGIVGKLTLRLARDTLKVDETLASMLKLVVTYAVILVCAIMILDVFGINTTSLIAILGAAGVAIGLALKDTLSNIASGIILLLLRSYSKGDFIEFGSVMGTVKGMDLFTTSLETAEGIYVSAPNSSIWGVPLKNYSRNQQRRLDIPVAISYTDSIDTAFAVLREIVAEEKRFLPDPAPRITVQSLGDSGVTIMLRAWAKTDVYWNVYADQTRNVKEKIEAAGLTIPFPQRDIHIIPNREG
jgi:small conductance mechanosensitive channel